MDQFEDTKHYCKDCKKEFIWTAGQKEFMTGLQRDGLLDKIEPMSGETTRGEITAPIRCEECRVNKKLRYHYFNLFPDRTSTWNIRESKFKAWLSAQTDEYVLDVLNRKR